MIGGTEDVLGLAADGSVSCERSGSPRTSESRKTSPILKTIGKENGIDVLRGTLNDVVSENVLQILQLPLEEFVGDSGENRGIQLED